MHIDYLEHHGILGQKWGVRRYQNPDGSLTDSGKKRYSQNDEGKQKERKKLTPQQKQKIKGIAFNAANLAILGYATYSAMKADRLPLDALTEDVQELGRSVLDRMKSVPTSSIKSPNSSAPREGGMRLDELYSPKQLRGWDNSYFDGYTNSDGSIHGRTVNLDGIPRKY